MKTKVNKNKLYLVKKKKASAPRQQFEHDARDFDVERDEPGSEHGRGTNRVADRAVLELVVWI